jgi:hypothetical protein
MDKRENGGFQPSQSDAEVADTWSRGVLRDGLIPDISQQVPPDHHLESMDDLGRPPIDDGDPHDYLR